MSTRLDTALKKYPDHEEGLRLLASRDPSGNLKYLDWAAKVLASKQALAPEIADILDLFHRFNGQWLRARRSGRGPYGRDRIRPDIYTYRTQDLAALRTDLLKLKRAQDTKRRKRERLYRIEGAVEADIVYDSPDLIVRHIKNKQASVHHGLNTKWCISMLKEGYFEDYEVQNATFFFFERKDPVGDEFDKVALVVPRGTGRGGERSESAAFTALDQRLDMMSLAKIHGLRVFDIFREIHERSEKYPSSALACVSAGNATCEQIEAVFAGKLSPWLQETICCNDATPLRLLEEILRRAPDAPKRGRRPDHLAHVMAALVIHPNVPDNVREKLTKSLRRRHVDISAIRRAKGHEGIEISFEPPHSNGHQYMTVKALRALAQRLDRRAAGARKKARTLQRKLTEKKRRAADRKRQTVARSRLTEKKRRLTERKKKVAARSKKER